MHLFKIVRGVQKPVLKISAEPAHIIDDGIHILLVFLRRIGIVKTEIEFPVVFERNAVIQAYRLRVADMQIAVWFGRKTGVHAPLIFVGEKIFVDNIPDEI